MTTDNSDEQQEKEQREESESGSPPTLEPADESKTQKERPSWVDLPRTVKKTFMEGDPSTPLFGFHLAGGAVSQQGVRIGFLADFLDAFRKVFAPLQVIPTGRIPEGNRLPVTTALPPSVAALHATASVTIYFSLDPEEWQLVAQERGAHPSTLLTVRAVGHLGALLRMDPGKRDLVKAVEPFGRRIGRSYGQLADILATYNVDADWWSGLYRNGEAEVGAPRAETIADELLRKPIPEERELTTGGFMWEAAMASKRRFVSIQLADRSIRAGYDIPLATQVTEALSHLVRVRLREVAYRYPFADSPHRREWELLEILEVGDAGGALADAAQEAL
ncbi:MAG: hypothetical protein M3355_11980 [Actinomycetota bacterium]|nr:hypothetical protein [Actinomycetota bacterium]